MVVELGAVLIAQREGADWRFTVTRQRVRVRALWEQVELDVESPSGTALGVTTLDDKRLLVIEVACGEFALLEPPNQYVNHLADFVPPNMVKGGIARDWVGNDVEHSKSVTWVEGQKRFRRCLLRERGRDNYVLPATCRADDPRHEVSIARVRIDLRRMSGGDFTLRRVLNLESQGSSNVLRVQLKGKEQEQKWLNELEVAIAEGTEITGVITAGGFEQSIPVQDGHGGWTQRIPIAVNEGVYVATASYPRSATMVLFRDAKQRLLASMRRVSPLNVEQFREELEAGYDEIVELPTRLYYVGRDTDAIEGEVIYHRMEWGYGLTLRVAESKLRFNGEPFSVGKSVIFHGDAVLSVCFLRSNALETGDGPMSTVLAIDEVSISAAESTTIFFQRLKYRMVHLLHLRMCGDQIFVARVAGFDQSRDAERRWFERIDARMDQSSTARLLERLKGVLQKSGKVTGESKDLMVLGRLDDNAYMESLGRSVVFQHVRLSFTSSDEGAALHSNEIVFLQMGRIERKENDVGVELHPPRNLANEDIGDDIRRLLVLRRAFSPRPGLLPRILENSGAGALEDKYVLVRLKYRADGKHRAYLLDDKLPRRTADAVASLIQAQQGPIYCAVNELRDSELDIELCVGILAHLPLSQIESVPEHLDKGAVIRIDTKAKGVKRFCVTRASFSESRYLDDQPRGVVVFPMTPLFRPDAPTNPRTRNANYWSGTQHFTIGGFPEIEARMGAYDERHQLGLANADQVVGLMKQPHPKLASMVLDDTRRARVLAQPQMRAGRIEIDQATLMVNKVALDDGDSVDLPWGDVTFADEPATTVARRLGRYWGYHDYVTGYWKGDEVIRTRVDVSTGLAGPLFFGLYDERPTLRYPYVDIKRYAFPVQELMNYLEKQQGGRSKLTVAGVAEDGGLFLEIAPGRIIEAPAQRIIWHSRLGEQTLRMQWEFFAAGDLVELELVRGDVFAVDRLMLLNWLPGPRRAFGGNGAWLPVQEYDSQTGGLKLGHGEYQVVIPVARTERYEESHVFLTTKNEIRKPQSVAPKHGDVALLTVDKNNQLKLMGFEQYKVQPVFWEEECWNDDPLAGFIIQRKDSRIFINQVRLRYLINAAGGCIPITIEQVRDDRGLIFFSRRYQKDDSKLKPEHQMLCYVLSSIGQGRALVRCGSGLVVVPTHVVVAGLTGMPEYLESAVMDKIREKEIPIWIHVEAGGIVNRGLMEEHSEEILVSAILVVDDPGHSEHTEERERDSQESLSGLTGRPAKRGILWRSVDSSAHYYMSSNDASWAELSAEELETIFLANGSWKAMARVKHQRDGLSSQISIVASSSAKRELNALSIGRELTVRVVYRGSDPEPGVARYIVASKISGVLLECIDDSYGRHKENTDLPVEVARFDTMRRGIVTVVPLGQRKYQVDLPEHLLTSLESRLMNRDSFIRSYLDIRRRTAEGGILTEAGSTGTDEVAICTAYAIIGSPADLRDYFPTIIRWVKHQMGVADFYLPYALMGIMVLFEASNLAKNEISKLLDRAPQEEVRHHQKNWGRLALALTRLVVDRALRSLHVETLTSQWIDSQENQMRKYPPIWTRLNQLRNHLQCPLSIENIQAITRFVLAADQNGNKEIIPISDALKASLGMAVEPSRLVATSNIVSELISIRSTLPVARSRIEPGLRRSHIKRLRLILDKIDAQGIDLQLLPYLPIDQRPNRTELS